MMCSPHQFFNTCCAIYFTPAQGLFRTQCPAWHQQLQLMQVQQQQYKTYDLAYLLLASTWVSYVEVGICPVFLPAQIPQSTYDTHVETSKTVVAQCLLITMGHHG